ncbi:MAG TPA: UDP-N-acetylglucosamine--N-acetylmuramyl-(pentapeptide) pyrophosphoryl-undecaprenol N-acetylglucosamine transferase [Gemmatimonadales bacterium]|nr:UDP-N-acetylglucosamine--N-acetylmuramyl-(pentapeptide) pyrophosphoryl-undecaprenol N-acetylglucosamine transferase [Gemmatimonadales bacterium]
MIRVLIAGGGTGGHLMPALALAEALVGVRGDVEPVLVGAVRGVEARILPTRPYRYHLLPTEPIYRRQWWRNARWIVVLPRLLGAVRRLLDAERPAVVVSTGGYAAGPVAFAAARRGIPIVVQEQNTVPGITTRRLAGRARQIHLGFPEAAARLHPGPGTEVFTLGNPITPPTFVPAADARAALGIAPDARVVLVTGASQGARAINLAVAEALDADAWRDVSLLWSTGPGQFAAFERYDAPPARQVRGFWDPIGEAYAAADVVVARAGAMTTAELQAWGLPSVLIPLPSAAAGHQAENARALAAAGAALHLPQDRLTGPALADAVSGLLADDDRRRRMAEAARRRGHPEAARAIAEAILRLI